MAWEPSKSSSREMMSVELVRFLIRPRPAYSASLMMPGPPSQHLASDREQPRQDSLHVFFSRLAKFIDAFQQALFSVGATFAFGMAV
jgi:hypothetical protein